MFIHICEHRTKHTIHKQIKKKQVYQKKDKKWRK